jgi:FkbM family methyltransferase
LSLSADVHDRLAEVGVMTAAAPFALRPGTNDDVIYRSVVVNNEYRVPDRLDGAVVLDIGMHVGAFSYLALTRGAGVVYGFEPESVNYARAAVNLAPFGGRARLSRRALWRSDVPAGPLHFFASSDAANAGGGTLIWETDGPLIETIPFDQAIDEASEGGRRRVDLVKIDCEGAEFPILLTSQRLDAIDRIVGEYHELRAEPPAHARVGGCPQFTLDALKARLESAGFGVESERQAAAQFGDLGLFFATRRR